MLVSAIWKTLLAEGKWRDSVKRRIIPPNTCSTRSSSSGYSLPWGAGSRILAWFGVHRAQILNRDASCSKTIHLESFRFFGSLLRASKIPSLTPYAVGSKHEASLPGGYHNPLQSPFVAKGYVMKALLAHDACLASMVVQRCLRAACVTSICFRGSGAKV